MNDHDALELLRLLHQYVQAYAPDIPQTVSALADDLAESQDFDDGGHAARMAADIRQTVVT